MDIVSANDRKYNIVNRIAHSGDMIFTTPELFDHDSSMHLNYDISYDKLYQVRESNDRLAYFDNTGSKTGGSCLAHREYLVAELIKDSFNRPKPVELGRVITVKKFLGITFYKKIVITYNSKTVGDEDCKEVKSDV
jgi:hypothetical protein